ncbi:uncharacterized protein LOC142543590 [Primulina tabacum]|uniref:uncharacterized protein LOC142543590 n=1 Tax=Primulina tabacum TaxID=48773 RepID=UPI003F590E77
MGTKRPNALHNFTFPADLRWGNQRFLRCIKVDSGDQVSPLGQFTANDAGSSDHHHQQSINQRRTTSERERDKDSPASELIPFGSLQMCSTPSPVSDGSRRISEVGDDVLAAMREDVKLDDQTAAGELKGAAFKDGHKDAEVFVSLLPPHPPVPQYSAVIPGEGETKTPWNLRKRPAACKTPLSGFIFGSNGGASATGVRGKALRADGATEVTDVLSRLRSGGNVAAICGEKLTREKFSVALSRKEIGEDFLAFTGHKPPRRPKKRAKILQRELNTLFPGLGLTEITADMYKVSEGAP